MSAYEKEMGVVHEATNFNLGNEPNNADVVPTVKRDPEVMKALVDDMRAAMASGPFTGQDKLRDYTPDSSEV